MIWRGICRKENLQGTYTISVLKGLRYITNFIYDFIANFEIGATWPPRSIIRVIIVVGGQVAPLLDPFNRFQIPLLHTIFLITSSVTVTSDHHALIENNPLFIFINLLRIYFTILQDYEYFEASATFYHCW